MLVVFAGIVWFSSTHTEQMITDMHQANSETVKYMLDQQIQIHMSNGDNEELQPLLESIVSERVADELTIVDADLVIARCSDTSQLQTLSSDPAWQSVFVSKTDTSVATILAGEPVEIVYHPFTNTGACTDCHDLPEGDVLGGLKVIRSKAALAETVSDNLMISSIIGVVGSLILLSFAVLLLRLKVFKPIAYMSQRMGRVSLGQIDQQFTVKSEDEIGRLLRSIHGTIMYMTDLAGAAKQISNNDLTARIELRSEDDVLGKSFGTMIDNLRDVIGQLAGNAREVAAVSEEIAASSEETYRDTGEQNDRVSQVSAAVTQMSSTMGESAKNAGEAAESAGQASDRATHGGELVKETMQGMRRVSEAVGQSSNLISKLADSAEQIGEIISVIDDIADQTNLLALNAAIEAARAGEQGRGFAVVADEVRKLAERTGKATSEITSMISGIQRETAEAVKSMDAGIKEVDQGRELTDNAGNTLAEIVQMSQTVGDMIRQMAAASDQQAAATDEISRFVEDISTITNKAATGAEKAATAAERLMSQAGSLRGVVDRFKTE